MTLFDLFLGNVLHIHFIIKIALSVFFGAVATGAIVKNNSGFFGFIVGVLTALLSFIFYLEAKNDIDAIPFNDILLPIVVPILSGLIGGYVGGFLSRKFISKTV